MLAISSYSENQLIVLIAQGNEQAFRQLFDHFWNKIYAVALMLTKSPVLSEEIVQDVFLKIWLKREQLPSVSKFEGYLFIVAKNHIYNVLRKKTTEQPFIQHLEQCFPDPPALPDQGILLKEANQLISRAVALLPRQQRIVFELSRYDELDHTKIAQKLGISKLTVKSHMTKALQFIRHYLQTHADESLLVICTLEIFLS